MSTRESFVERFGEADAASIERAAVYHKGEFLESDKVGSDTFRDAIVIALGFECMSADSYREYHGITAPWADIQEWIRTDGQLAHHDGPVDYLAMFAGVYNEYVGIEAEA